MSLNHPDEEAIIRYVSEQTSEQEQFDMDKHFSDCTSCSKSVRTMFFIRENFDALWDNWSAAEHGRLSQQLVLANALRQASQTRPALSDEIRRWLGQLGEGLCVSARVLLDRSRKIALLGTSALPAGFEFRVRPAYIGIGSPKEQAKVNEHLQKSSELLSQHKAEQAVDELLQAVKIDARSSQVSTLSIVHQDNRLFEVHVDSIARTVLLMFWPVEGQGYPRLAILAPEEGACPATPAEFKPVEGADYFLAEFGNVGDGIYSMTIGPLKEKT